MNETNHVRLKSDPTSVGSLTGREQLRRGRPMVQVRFPDGARWIPASNVERVDGFRLSPLDMLESKRLARPADLRRTLTHVKLSGRLADVIYSMEATNTDFYAYQFKPVVKLLESPSNGILIADEVGLGKTIETGLIWTELRSRFDMRRLMVVCPAALREKWKRELAVKFGVTAQICDARETLEVLTDPDAQARGFAIIASTQGLRPPRNWEDPNDNQSSAAKLARYLRSMESEDRLIDLLVIDEAHHLRNAETRTHELGGLLKAIADYAAFLTATPIHNRNDDLFSLLQLLDPDTFTRPEAFSQILEANRPLVQARDLVLSRNLDADRLQSLLDDARKHPLLRNNRQLALIPELDLRDDRLSRRDVRSRLAYRLETVNLLAHVVTRTRKRDVKEWRVVRDPVPEYVRLEDVERRFYDLVTDVVVNYAMERQASERFLLAQPQRQMTSSMAAALRSWQRRLIELEEFEEANENIENESRAHTIGPLVGEIVRRSRDYVDLEDLIESDTKYNRLKSMIASYIRQHSHEKIVVFSAFRATLSYLYERLTSDGITCLQLTGGQRETKDETIQRFKDPAGPSILLSSEVGGEGVDLQFSRVVVNYDLPWNPMRLEQRIGRVDRLGQEADKVLIWNLLAADTIDARIYERLYNKLDLCRSALGDFEAILGEEIRMLEYDLLAGRLSPDEQERRIDQTAQALENLRLEEENLEHDAASLVAYGDYILNHVQAARDLHRWVNGEDIRAYVSDYLSRHYPGCDIRLTKSGSSLYDVSLSDQAKVDLAEFIEKKRLSYMTRLTSMSPKPVRCRFQNRVGVNSAAGEEIISQFHPLMRMVSERITEGDEQLTPAVALKITRDALGDSLPSGRYILAAALWSFRGLQDSERLAYAAAPMENFSDLLDPEVAERMAIAAVESGTDWIEARNQVDLEQAYVAANEGPLGHLDDEFIAAEREIAARNEDRADLQLRTLDQHLLQQVAKLEAIRDQHRSLGRESLAKATVGRIDALRKRVEQQKLRIEGRRSVRSDAKEIAIAIVQIS